MLAAFRYLNSEEVLSALRTFDPLFGVLLLLVPALQLWLKSLRFDVFLRPFKDQTGEGDRTANGSPQSGTIMRAYAAGQPATLLPGGIAARIGLLRQAGVPLATGTTVVLFSSLADQAVFILGLFALAIWFPVARAAALITLGALVVVGLLLFVPQVRAFLGGLLLRLLKRFGWAEHAENFGAAVRKGLVDRRVLLLGLGLSVVAFASDVFLLDFSLRGVGAQLPLAQVYVAYLLPTMLGRLSALPAGGIGLTEAGITGYLVATSGLDASTAVVAAAMFRVSTVFLQALYGAVVYWFAWKGERERPEPVESAG